MFSHLMCMRVLYQNLEFHVIVTRHVYLIFPPYLSLPMSFLTLVKEALGKTTFIIILSKCFPSLFRESKFNSPVSLQYPYKAHSVMILNLSDSFKKEDRNEEFLCRK